MSAKTLLFVTALIEAGAGVALLIVPSWVGDVLLGEGLASPQALVVARIAGAAVLALALACSLARNSDRPTKKGLVAGMLIYNLAVPIVLVQYWNATGLAGLGLWPASGLHGVLAVWCVACLRH